MKKEKNANQSENSAATTRCVTDAARRRMNLRRVRRREGGREVALFKMVGRGERGKEKKREEKTKGGEGGEAMSSW